ncbi:MULTISPECIES: histidine kinase [Paenibacillus]|jgi:archaellum component FlaC|uniref:histidine kinase n=1 Tax=Paenibacillus TaxID=44249 RepID=UPI00096DB0B1|nr:histidine kinase [Paenibacillus sp. FSL H8-0259]OMF21609.1 histidine kinase [Paenibacillus sp. FSL H8-0259]
MSDPILQQILTELQGMKSDLSEVKSELSEVKSELGTMKADIDSIKEDTKLIPLIQQAVSEVNAEVIATRDTLERIDKTLTVHDATLDMLARRSIDQEAALKRIK